MLRALTMSFYAVARGKQTGVFRSWPECQKQVNGFRGASFKKFASMKEAQQFVEGQPPAKKSKTSSQLVDHSALKKFAPSKSRVTKTKEETEQEEIDAIANCDFKDEDELNFLKMTEYAEEPETSKSNVEPKRKNPYDIKFEAPEPTKEKIYHGHTFYEDSKGFVHVYTDGSCENNGKKKAAAGLGVFFGENHKLNASEPVQGRATNNVGEIQAAIRAIEDAQKCNIKRLNIFTDSQFLINSVCKWMSGWKRKNWKLATGKPVANEPDFKRLDTLIDSGNMAIKWSYIPAHKGYTGNEAADQLAKDGAKQYKS